MQRLRTVTLDVRAQIRAGADPFVQIMSAVAALKEDEQLRLIAPFKPVPLLSVMRNRGFSHVARSLEGDAWEVVFTRQEAAADPAAASAVCGGGCAATPVVTLDARGLEPPEPLMRILEALGTLPLGAELHAHTDRRPLHLFPHLEERGFVGESEAQPDGSFVTRIFRRSQ